MIRGSTNGTAVRQSHGGARVASEKGHPLLAKTTSSKQEKDPLANLESDSDDDGPKSPEGKSVSGRTFKKPEQKPSTPPPQKLGPKNFKRHDPRDGNPHSPTVNPRSPEGK